MLLLFDIDGTLTIGGPGKSAFRVALERTYGTAGPIVNHDFSGKTDPLLLRELLTAAGHESHEIEARRPRFWDSYLAELEARIDTDPVAVLPGVRELIAALEARSDVYLGLVTGNVKGGARVKLGSVRLWRHFPVGAFGCDHEVRDELPPVALQRAAAQWGRPFSWRRRGRHRRHAPRRGVREGGGRSDGGPDDGPVFGRGAGAGRGGPCAARVRRCGCGIGGSGGSPWMSPLGHPGDQLDPGRLLDLHSVPCAS